MNQVSQPFKTGAPQRFKRACFDQGERRYLFEKEVKEATNMMLSRIADTFQRVAGGAMSWDAIILTGGGSDLFHKQLLPILHHERVHPGG